MTPTPPVSTPQPGAVVCCDVLAHGSLRVTEATLSDWRHQPGPILGNALPASSLKHADEQTIAALAVVFRAIQHYGLATTSFTDWGVLAAPRLLGRVAMATALQRFAAEGAWGISPHLIPHRSLHSISGTLSQALQIRGPNFGVGGATAGVVEALLNAVVLVEGNRLPGVWVALTGWEPEPIPDAVDPTVPEPICHAVALALVAAQPNFSGLRLRVAPGQRGGQQAEESSPPRFRLEALWAALAQMDPASPAVRWQLDGGGWMELQGTGAESVLPSRESNRRIHANGRAEAKQVGAGAERQL